MDSARHPAPAIKEIWGLYPNQRKSFILSVTFQSAVVAVLFLIFSSPAVQQRVRETATLILPPDLAPHPRSTHGGGGGGNRSPMPASKGRLPKPAPRQFVPPSAAPAEVPKLATEPTIIAPPDLTLPDVNVANYGDPLGRIGPLSNGTGTSGGIGSGKGGDVGPGRGSGAGDGEGGGFGGAVFGPGGGITQPVAIYSPEPEFSEEGRKARLQGTVVITLVVDAAGKPRNLKVVRSLGLGLDEEALKAVAQWRFKPGTKNGKPVAVSATVHAIFHLL
jgi:TonB family protein